MFKSKSLPIDPIKMETIVFFYLSIFNLENRLREMFWNSLPENDERLCSICRGSTWEKQGQGWWIRGIKIGPTRRVSPVSLCFRPEKHRAKMAPPVGPKIFSFMSLCDFFLCKNAGLGQARPDLVYFRSGWTSKYVAHRKNGLIRFCNLAWRPGRFDSSKVDPLALPPLATTSSESSEE